MHQAHGFADFFFFGLLGAQGLAGFVLVVGAGATAETLAGGATTGVLVAGMGDLVAGTVTGFLAGAATSAADCLAASAGLPSSQAASATLMLDAASSKAENFVLNMRSRDEAFCLLMTSFPARGSRMWTCGWTQLFVPLV